MFLCLQTPKFYAPTPPAPAGLQWWNYAAGVPPLPEPASVLGQAYSSYGWKYDDQYSAQSYSFSQLDHVRLQDPSFMPGAAYSSQSVAQQSHMHSLRQLFTEM